MHLSIGRAGLQHLRFQCPAAGEDEQSFCEALHAIAHIYSPWLVFLYVQALRVIIYKVFVLCKMVNLGYRCQIRIKSCKLDTQMNNANYERFRKPLSESFAYNEQNPFSLAILQSFLEIYYTCNYSLQLFLRYLPQAHQVVQLPKFSNSFETFQVAVDYQMGCHLQGLYKWMSLLWMGSLWALWQPSSSWVMRWTRLGGGKPFICSILESQLLLLKKDKKSQLSHFLVFAIASSVHLFKNYSVGQHIARYHACATWLKKHQKLTIDYSCYPFSMQRYIQNKKKKKAVQKRKGKI